MTAGDSQARTPEQIDPSHIMQVGMGFWASKTLLSAVELELFTKLGSDSMTGAQIADALSAQIGQTIDRRKVDLADTIHSIGPS